MQKEQTKAFDPIKASTNAPLHQNSEFAVKIEGNFLYSNMPSQVEHPFYGSKAGYFVQQY